MPILERHHPRCPHRRSASSLSHPDSDQTAPARVGSPLRPRLDRDLSWLAFNHRVLREAADPDVAIFDRLAFLAIFSSNLDEFFRVRVAALRARVRAGDGGSDAAPEAAALLERIRQQSTAQQEEFGRIFREEIVPALAAEGIALTDEHSLPGDVRAELDRTFRERVQPELRPVRISRDSVPFLRNRAIYLVAELCDTGGAAAEAADAFGLVEIPTPRVPRFVDVERGDGSRVVIFVDDLIRLHLPELFPDCAIGAVHSVKLSRDAELYLEEEQAAPRSEAIRRSLGKRETGLPTRFLIDQSAPPAMVRELRELFGLAGADLIEGGRYHNLHDLHAFPRGGRADLASPPLAPLPHPQLTTAPSVLASVAERDRLLHLPYQEYEPVLRFLREAAADPEVEEVWATLYRVAPESAVVQALVTAAQAGKRVTAIVEVQARFDEAANLAWADRLQSAGVRTIHGIAGLKVHAKLLLAVRREGAETRRLACLSTGNFNERTARSYTDHVLLTARQTITTEVHDLFRYLAGDAGVPDFEQLMVAPFDLRDRLTEMLEQEAERAARGEPARAILKLNSLQDPEMIDKLYRVSQRGVRIELIVRGICCVVPGVTGLSANVAARSIIDRFLEHGRVYVFHAGGEEHCYLSSADLMTRNLSHRIEVAFPILDEEARRQVRALLRFQLDDDRKARSLEGGDADPSPRRPWGARRAQVEIHRFLQALAGESRGVPTPPPATSAVPGAFTAGEQR